jgi:protein tyrosine phosphatase (PTP) superfamily phosphohydrolase (DUF442 family)
LNELFNYSVINDELVVGTTPRATDYDLLRTLGVGLVINMRFERRPYPDLHDPPLKFLWLPTIDWPLFPIPIGMLMRGALQAVTMIETGKSVYTHCAGGRHRGVAMAAAILIARGYSADEAMQLISDHRPVADPHVFYIRYRILRFARHWYARDLSHGEKQT